MLEIFLSASVPLPDRDPYFMDSVDVVAIREAIKALVREIIPIGHIVYGGHPAITPLMTLLLRGQGARAMKKVTLYQSAYFAEQFPKENDEFLDVRVVPAVAHSRKRSLDLMRRRMIQDTDFQVGIFIGGMEGVLKEFETFREAHPYAQVWPIASTGAAAAKIFENMEKPRPELFQDEFTYSTLFRHLLKDVTQRRL